MKTCRICNEEQVLENFHNNSETSDGKTSYCKVCTKEKTDKRSLAGRILLKPIQRKHKVTQRDAAILWGMKDKKTVENFTKYVGIDYDNLENCWEWTGSLTEKGYGRINITDGKSLLGAVLAHRFMWAIKHGFDSLPKSTTSGSSGDTVVINHLCHNRACVNPDHLEAITSRENLSSAKRKPKETADV